MACKFVAVFKDGSTSAVFEYVPPLLKACKDKLQNIAGIVNDEYGRKDINEKVKAYLLTVQS